MKLEVSNLVLYVPMLLICRITDFRIGERERERF